MNLEPLLLQLTDRDQLDLVRPSHGSMRIDQAAIDSGLVDEDAWLELLGREFGMPVVDLNHITIDRELLVQFPTKAIFQYEFLPLREVDGAIEVAVSDPFAIDQIDELTASFAKPLQPVLARRRDVSDQIKELLGVGGDTIGELVRIQQDEEGDPFDDISQDFGELAESAQIPSVIRLVNELLVEAVEQHASDVHVEPDEKGLTVRFRVDGILRVQPVPPEINQFASAIVTRLKIMSRLNIAEKRLPQDGRIKVKISGREIDVRVSIIPMIYGEGVVMRLLDKERMVFDLKKVGMPDYLLPTFEELIRIPHGIVLVTGPTGSGKSTTLYSALGAIKSPETKIITVEDPVEYYSPGISQIQVHSKIGLTFSAGLRSILRHDPDVILIGEIRDNETAVSAIQASLTGHLVFSTLHTNDAPGAITRLIDMGVEPYLVSSTVEGVLAQRLIRRLCTHCKEAFQPLNDEVPPDFPTHDVTLYRQRGCRHCRETGYAGRLGIFELMINDHTTREMTNNGASSIEIRRHVIKQGMLSLRDCGWQYVLKGLTSIDEVVRVTKGDILPMTTENK